MQFVTKNIRCITFFFNFNNKQVTVYTTILADPVYPSQIEKNTSQITKLFNQNFADTKACIFSKSTATDLFKLLQLR